MPAGILFVAGTQTSEPGQSRLLPHLHPVHIARIETGVANATVATLVALAHAYEVSLVTLFGSRDDQ